MPKYWKRISWILTVLISGIILGGVFIPPLLIVQKPELAQFFYSLYASLCHQQAERCYRILGQPLAVCSRCLGIYSGFFFFSLVYPILGLRLKNWARSRPYLILIAAIPMVLDVVGGLFRIWSSPLMVRSITGFFWSSTLPFFWFPALEELWPKEK